MPRYVHAVVAIALLAFPPIARADQQAAPLPAVEVGVDAALARDFYDGGGRPWGPRVTFNLSPETALVVFGENSVAKARVGAYSWSSRLLGAEIRQAVAQSGPFAFNVIAGGGTSFRTDSRPHVGTGPLPAVIVGAGFGQRLGRHVSVRQELRFVLAGDGSELRAQAGISVPLGRYPTGGVVASHRFGAAIVRTGQHVWVTRTDGSEVAGPVIRIDADDITLAASTGTAIVPTTDVMRIERPDRIRDGATRGVALGAAAGVGVLAIASASCRGDCMTAAGVLIVGAGMGGGLGVAFGAIVDGLHRTRDAIFEQAAPAPVATIVPVAAPGRVGVAAHVAW